MSLNNNAYHQLAPYYDASTSLRIYKVYRSLIGNIKNKRILDLGCGTGTLLKSYAEHNECHGMDCSPDMIKIAKKKDKKSVYSIGDIRSFKYNKNFDGIICAFDTINHLPLFKDWHNLFIKTHAHLNNNGIFYFDYNTRDGFSYYNGKTVFKIIGSDYTIRHIKFVAPNTCKWHIHNFIKLSNDSYSHTKAEIKERAYPIDKIEKELRKLFHTMIKKNDGNRIYYKLKKKAA